MENNLLEDLKKQTVGMLNAADNIVKSVENDTDFFSKLTDAQKKQFKDTINDLQKEKLKLEKVIKSV
jgi:hypothetical protein